MKPEQANATAERLKGLIPRMTDEQLLYWAERFESFELAPATAAVDAYVEEFEELSTPRLLAMVRAASSRRADPRQAERSDDAGRLLHLRDVDQAIDEMGDVELATLKVLVVASVADDWARAKLERCDPRRSAWLKGLIFDWIHRQGDTPNDAAASHAGGQRP